MIVFQLDCLCFHHFLSKEELDVSLQRHNVNIVGCLCTAGTVTGFYLLPCGGGGVGGVNVVRLGQILDQFGAEEASVRVFLHQQVDRALSLVETQRTRVLHVLPRHVSGRRVQVHLRPRREKGQSPGDGGKTDFQLILSDNHGYIIVFKSFFFFKNLFNNFCSAIKTPKHSTSLKI